MKMNSWSAGALSGMKNARDDHLVTRLAGEDVGRADSGRHVHEAALGLVERRGGDADVEHDDVAFGRVVGHGVGLEGGLGVVGVQLEHSHFLPVCPVRLLDVHILVVDVIFGDIDLDIAAGAEVEMLASGELHYELLDECGHVLVAYHLALEFLDTEDALGNEDFEVLAHLYLASEPPVVLLLLAGEESHLGGQDAAAAGEHLAFAHAAASAASAGRGQEYLLVGEGCQQGRAGIDIEDSLPVVDVNLDVALRGQLGLGHQ